VASTEAKHVAVHTVRKSLPRFDPGPQFRGLQVLTPDFLANVQHRKLGFLPREVTAEPVDKSVAELVAASGHIKKTFPDLHRTVQVVFARLR
jgi:hypothetical protein